MKFTMMIVRWLWAGIAMTGMAISGSGQCAMCKASIANAQNAAEVSATVNAAVLVLLLPTLVLIGGVVRLVFKYRHSPQTDSYDHFRSSPTQRDSQ